MHELYLPYAHILRSARFRKSLCALWFDISAAGQANWPYHITFSLLFIANFLIVPRILDISIKVTWLYYSVTFYIKLHHNPSHGYPSADIWATIYQLKWRLSWGHILRCCESTTKGFHSKERILIYQYNYLIPFYFLRGEFVIYCSKTKIRVKEGSYFIEVCVPHFNVLGLIRSHCASMFCIMNSF